MSRGVLTTKWFDGRTLHYEGEVVEITPTTPMHLIRVLPDNEEAPVNTAPMFPEPPKPAQHAKARKAPKNEPAAES